MSVSARWVTLPRPDDLTMASEVAIADAKGEKLYRLVAHLDQGSGEIRGWRLTKLSDGSDYDLDPNNGFGWSCDCPDGTYRCNRPGGCRHVQAIQQLLASLDGEMERAALEREQEQDRAGEPFPWPTDEELELMAREYEEEERCGRWFEADDVPA